MKAILHSGSGGYLRRTIGFKSEVVEDREDHDTFPVQTGASYMPPSDDDYEAASMPPRMRKRPRKTD